jgi:hypothetical protein
MSETFDNQGMIELLRYILDQDSITALYAEYAEPRKITREDFLILLSNLERDALVRFYRYRESDRKPVYLSIRGGHPHDLFSLEKPVWSEPTEEIFAELKKRSTQGAKSQDEEPPPPEDS